MRTIIKQKGFVFCTIKGRYWSHLVKKKTFVGGADEFLYTISNIKGFENGTIPLGNIYRKCTDHWKINRGLRSTVDEI